MKNNKKNKLKFKKMMENLKNKWNGEYYYKIF